MLVADREALKPHPIFRPFAVFFRPSNDIEDIMSVEYTGE